MWKIYYFQSFERTFFNAHATANAEDFLNVAERRSVINGETEFALAIYRTGFFALETTFFWFAFIFVEDHHS